MEQRIGEVHLKDGTRVSFATAGKGPFLIFVPGWLSHLELGWALPAERRFYEALADGRTLVRYDRPGCGLSDDSPRTDLADLEMEVLDAVVTAVGAKAFDLLGASMSAPLAVKWAAHHPGTVTNLVLYGGWVSGDRIAAPKIREHVLGLVEQNWGLGSDVLTDIFAPEADAGFRAYFSEYQRLSAPPETARRILAACYDLDVGGDLAGVTASTTVIHRRDDRAVPIEEGERLAEGIPGAIFVSLSGRTHIPFVGDVDALVDAVRTGLSLPRLRRRFQPSLTGRQLEVAALVAQGMSNRQIADRLVITERSAESHVERILTRLGFRSRTQIATWYVAVTA